MSIKDLRQAIEGEIHSDHISRTIYSVDASIYEVLPMAVCVPKHLKDLQAAVAIAAMHKIPIIARGAATGITGGCLGTGLILDTSKYLNRIESINTSENYAICQPGVVQDRLNEILHPHGLRLGPDTSTGNRATLGGMLANNAAGSRSLLYGKMADHILEVELLLADGRVLILKEMSWVEVEQQAAAGKFKEIFAALLHIKKEYKADIARQFPKIPRRVSGYNLDELIASSGTFNPAKLIAGSEGSLGVIQKLKIGLSPLPKNVGLVLLHFHDMLKGLQTVTSILEWKPIALEMIDSHILQAGAVSPALRGKLSWLHGKPAAIFAIEFEEASEALLKRKLADFQSFVQANHIGYHAFATTIAETMESVWSVRKAGVGLLLSKRSYSRAIAFIEDISVAPQRLSEFMTDFIACLKKHGKEAGIYGHIGSGCMHIRPYINLKDPDELAIMQQVMNEVAGLLLQYGGSPSGEHGDGMVRSWLNPKMYGPRVYRAFLELKQAFDPQNLMNPGKVVNGQDLLEHLRLNPGTVQRTIPTFLDFSREGGLALAADMCNGNAQCRKKEGLMCPSFQATDDEHDTTRARAQSLRAIINGILPRDALTGKELGKVLDLCLECKGCKKECPSIVDMAKMKAEILYQQQRKHGYSWRGRLFAHIDRLNQWASHVPALYNTAINSKLFRKGLHAIGITANRKLPSLADERFSALYKTAKVSSRKVVLFNDTYCEFNEPQIGTAAIAVLEAFGCEVIIPSRKCCGRPAISKGFLEQAKDKAEQLVAQLYPYAQQGYFILGLEPSCLSAIQDDYLGLLGYDHTQAVQVAAQCMLIEDYIAILLLEQPYVLGSTQQPVLVHGHCHQKTLFGMEGTMRLLKQVAPNSQLLDTGCCGLAGSFGYELEHEAISTKIANLRLIPAILKASSNTRLLTSGFSCRSQIRHLTSKSPIHIIEFLSSLIKI